MSEAPDVPLPEGYGRAENLFEMGLRHLRAAQAGRYPTYGDMSAELGEVGTKKAIDLASTCFLAAGTALSFRLEKTLDMPVPFEPADFVEAPRPTVARQGGWVPQRTTDLSPHAVRALMGDGVATERAAPEPRITDEGVELDAAESKES